MLFKTWYQTNFLFYEYCKHVFSQFFLNHIFHIILNYDTRNFQPNGPKTVLNFSIIHNSIIKTQFWWLKKSKMLPHISCLMLHFPLILKIHLPNVSNHKGCQLSYLKYGVIAIIHTIVYAYAYQLLLSSIVL